MMTWKPPVTYNEAGYIYDANGAIICHSSGGHAEAIVEALNSLAQGPSVGERVDSTYKLKHSWWMAWAEPYEIIYECVH